MLSIPTDHTLLSTRELIFQRAGYSVWSALDREVTRAMDLPIDLVVFCHSIGLDRAESIIRTTRLRNPHVTSVLLTLFDAGQIAGFDLTCNICRGPVRLLEEIAAIRKPEKSPSWRLKQAVANTGMRNARAS